MKHIKLYLLLIVASAFSFYSCEAELEPRNTNYVTFADSGFSTLVDPGASATVSIPVYTANITGADRSFTLVADGSGAPAGSYSVPATVTIPANTNEGTIEVTVNDPQNIAQNRVVIEIPAEDGLSVGGSTTVTFAQSCNEVTGTLNITFDGYGSETGWTVFDELGGVVATASAGTYADGQASATESITLCQGRSYTFTITDTWGDGLSFPADGSYSLTVGGAVKASGGGDFGTSQSTDFNTN